MSYVSRIFSYPILRAVLLVAVIVVLLVLVWCIAQYPGSEEDGYFTRIVIRILGVLLIAILTTVLLSGWFFLYRWLVRRRRQPGTPGVTDTSGNARMFRRIAGRTAQSHAASRWWQFLFRQQSALPWYLLLGASQSGKTTAVCRSGHFFSPQEQLTAEQISGAGETTCHCWLAHDAVYLESDGQFISEPESSTESWHDFVRILKKYRPSKSVQGTILTISAPDLMDNDSVSVSELAGVFRARLSALQQIAGISFPVYVVITHLDRLQGFGEYFHYLSDEERHQLWGITLPWGMDNSSMGEYTHQQLQQLAQRIDAGLNRRLQNEYDLPDRRRMYVFPEELQLLCQQLGTFVHALSFVSLYEEPSSLPALRGVYLTSSGQNTRQPPEYTPGIISRWYSRFSTSDSDAQVTTAATEPTTQTEDITGRPCFLQQLFCELTINDQRLARDTRLTFIRFCRQRWPMYLLLLLIVSGLLYGLSGGFTSHSRYLKGVKQQLSLLHGQQDDLQREYSLQTTARLLEGLRGLSQPPDNDAGRIIFADSEVASVSKKAYQSALRQLLLPQAEQYAGMALRQAVIQADMTQLFRQLRIYMMIYGLLPADALYLAGIISPALILSEGEPGYRRDIDLVPDLVALFSDPAERETRQGADLQLLSQARELLSRQDRPARIYQQLLQRLSTDSPPAFSLAALSEGSEGAWFVVRTDAPRQTIDGLYTSQGYLLVKKQLLPLLVDLDREDRQVMRSNDSDSGTVTMTETAALGREVFSRYLDDYTSYWQQMLSSIRISPPMVTGPQASAAGQQQDLYRLSRLVVTGSPLVRLLERLVAETTLSSAESWFPAIAGIAVNNAASQRILGAGQRWVDTVDQLVWMHTDSHFAALRQFVTGREKGFTQNQSAEQGSGLKLLLGQLNELQLLFRLNEDPLTSQAPATWPALAAGLRAGAQSWPDPLKNIILPLVDQISLRIRSVSVIRSNSGIKDGPGAFCRKSLAGHYPFADSPLDVSLADFSRFFAPGGITDNYFRQYLADKVDTSVKPWKFINTPAGDPRHQVLQMFRQAREIRSLFFSRNDSHQLNLPLSLSVNYLSPAINQLELEIGAERLSYSHGPVRPLHFQWPEATSSLPLILRLTASTQGDIHLTQWSGPWSLFRWIESASTVRVQPSGELRAEFSPAGKKIVFSLTGLVSGQQPVMALLRRFSCR